MSKRLICVVAVACVVAAGLPSSAAAVSRSTALSRALDFLHARQYANGGLGERGKGSSEQLTAWGIVAITAAGQNPNTWTRGPNSPVTFLSRSSSRWRVTTDYARTLLAAAAAGRDPRAFGGVNLIDKIKADVHRDGSHGDRIGNAVNSHVWAMIALRAVGETVTDEQVRWLKGQQNADGGWGWAPSAASDTNDTAAAIEALVAAGESPGSGIIRSGVGYLRSRQRSDGGFGYGSGATDSGSTSWVIQALVKARAGVTGRSWRKRGVNPVGRLCGFQSSNGSMRYTASREQNPLFMTVQAVPALALRAFPVRYSSSLRSASYFGPCFSGLRPSPNSSLPKGSPVEVRFTIDDAGGTGVASGSIRVKIDGARKTARVSGGIVNVEAGVLDGGTHGVTIQAADRAGNTSTMDDWRFAVGPESPQLPFTPSTDPEGGASPSTTGSPSQTTTSTGEPQPSTGAAPGTESGGTQPGQESQQGSIDKWSDAVKVEPGSEEARTPLLNEIGYWALIVLAFFVPTFGGVALITWISRRRARRKARKKEKAAAAQAERQVAEQQAAALQQATAAQAAATRQAVATQGAQPPVMEQTAVWPPPAQQPLPPVQQPVAAGDQDSLSPDQEAAWQAWQSQPAEPAKGDSAWVTQREQPVVAQPIEQPVEPEQQPAVAEPTGQPEQPEAPAPPSPWGQPAPEQQATMWPPPVEPPPVEPPPLPSDQTPTDQTSSAGPDQSPGSPVPKTGDQSPEGSE